MYIRGLLERYNLLAKREEIYPWFSHKDLTKVTNEIVQVPNQEEIKIIDLMSGKGDASNEIKKYLLARGVPVHLTLLDFCQKMLDLADPKPDAIRCGDVLNNELGAESFNLVILRLSLQDIPINYQSEIFKEAYRLLVPQGQFILISHISNQNNLAAINAILSAADQARGISYGRYIPGLWEITANLDLAGFHQPFPKYYFSSPVEYCRHEIASPQREKEWFSLIKRLQQSHLLKQCNLSLSEDRPWYYEIPGVIISAMK
jgi:ubiquinone/menaquinone biosynthesis C-methylase UbiE